LFVFSSLYIVVCYHSRCIEITSQKTNDVADDVGIELTPRKTLDMTTATSSSNHHAPRHRRDVTRAAWLIDVTRHARACAFQCGVSGRCVTCFMNVRRKNACAVILARFPSKRLAHVTDWHLNCAVLVSRIKMHTLPLVMRCYQVLRRCSEFVLHRRSLCFFQSAQTSKAFAWLPVSPGTSIFVLSAFCHSHKQYAHHVYTERQKKEPIFFCVHLFSTT